MKRTEIFFLLLVIACLLSFAIYTIGGALQDVDYHELAKLPLTEQQSGYEKMETRRNVGEKMQLVGAILIFISFLGLLLTSLAVGYQNAEKRLAKAEQAALRQ